MEMRSFVGRTNILSSSALSTLNCLKEVPAVTENILNCLKEVPAFAGFECLKEINRAELKHGEALTCYKEVARPEVKAGEQLECLKEVFRPGAMLGQPLNCEREVVASSLLKAKPGVEISCAREAVST